MAAPPDIVLKTDVHFGRFFRDLFWKEMVELSLWQPKVQAIFTVGKSNPHWRQVFDDDADASSASGIVVEADRAESKDEYHGTFLVDVKQVAQSNISTSLVVGQTDLSMRKKSFGEYRFKILHVMAHEYYHLIQRWRVGGVEHARAYTRTYKQIQKQVREKREKMGKKVDEAFVSAAAHARHPDEQVAERISYERLLPHRRSIDKGLWDVAVPIQLLRHQYERN